MIMMLYALNFTLLEAMLQIDWGSSISFQLSIDIHKLCSTVATFK